MMKKLIFGLLAAITGWVLVGLWLPTDYQVERSQAVDRQPDAVFPLLDGFVHFHEWSPLLKRDPQARYRVSGPPHGVGARFSWQGDARTVGTGFIEVTEARPNRFIAMNLEVESQGEATSFFRIEPMDGGSMVTWGLNLDTGRGRGFFSGLLYRYFGLLLDSWLGPDLEEGLRDFRQLSESLPSGDFSKSTIDVVDVEPFPILFVSGQTSQAASDVAGAIADAFAEISAFLEENGITTSGQPIAITRAWDENGYQFDAAVPVPQALPELTGRLQTGFSPGGKAVRIVHRGPYEDILETYRKLTAYMAVHGLEESGLSWERYVTDPAATVPADSITEIYVQIEAGQPPTGK